MFLLCLLLLLLLLLLHVQVMFPTLWLPTRAMCHRLSGQLPRQPCVLYCWFLKYNQHWCLRQVSLT